MPMIEYRPVRDNVREPATDKKYRELETIPAPFAKHCRPRVSRILSEAR